MDHLEAAANENNKLTDDLFKFRALIGYQGPLKATDPNWKGCKYNVLVDWETGEKTYESLSVLAADDPVTCATYAKKNDLLHIDGWKRFRNLEKHGHNPNRRCNAVKDQASKEMKQNTCLVFSSPGHTRKPWNLKKRTTTPNGLMQSGMKWIASRNKKSSPHAKGPNGIQTTNQS